MMPAARRHVEAIARSKHDLLTFGLRKQWEALQVGRLNIDGAHIAARRCHHRPFAASIAYRYRV